jgi:hypothetical protein
MKKFLEEQERMIQGLLNERRGYEMRGKKDRVALVDQQLRELGFEPTYFEKSVETAAVEPESERAVAPKARKRKA